MMSFHLVELTEVEVIHVSPVGFEEEKQNDLWHCTHGHHDLPEEGHALDEPIPVDHHLESDKTVLVGSPYHDLGLCRKWVVDLKKYSLLCLVVLENTEICYSHRSLLPWDLQVGHDLKVGWSRWHHGRRNR